MNKLKMIGLVSTLALMSACSSTTYQIKSEKSDVVDTVPKWYMSNINETEACNLDTNLIGMVKDKDKEIYRRLEDLSVVIWKRVRELAKFYRA